MWEASPWWWGSRAATVGREPVARGKAADQITSSAMADFGKSISGSRPSNGSVK